MFRIDNQSRTPVFEQIVHQAEEYVRTGILKPGDKLPSIRELTSLIGVNPNTIQKAYRDLEAEGYIYSLRAKGSFVAQKLEVVKRSDTAEILTELSALVSKIRFLGITYEEANEILIKEYKGKE